MPHRNCIPKGRVEPGYIYRKKMLPFDFMNPIEEAKRLKELKNTIPRGEAAVETMEAAGYGDEKTILMKINLLKLPSIVQNWIVEGRLRTSIGYKLYAIKDVKICTGLARRSITERLSVKGVERIMTDMREKGVY